MPVVLLPFFSTIKFGCFVGTKNNSKLNINLLDTKWIGKHFEHKFTEVFPDLPVCNETTMKQLSFHLLSHQNVSPAFLCHTQDALSVSYLTIYFHTQYCRAQSRPALTWHQAAELCEISHGTLPVFQSRQELEEFVTILKLTKYKTGVISPHLGVEAPSFHTLVQYANRDLDIYFMYQEHTQEK